MKSKEKVKKNKVDKKSRVAAGLKKDLSICYKSIKELKPYKNNPRIITDKAIETVKNSIAKFGIKVPLVIDKKNIIICGHTRFKAICMLKIEKPNLLNYDKIPCVLADDLSDSQVNAFRIVDNKTSEFSQWDEDLLFEELENITDPEIDLSDFGIEIEEPDESLLFDGLEKQENELYLSFGKNKIKITKDEYQNLNNKLNHFLQEYNTNKGFVRFLLNGN